MVATVSLLALGIVSYRSPQRQAQSRFGLWLNKDHHFYLSPNGLFYWFYKKRTVAGRYNINLVGRLELEICQTTFPYRQALDSTLEAGQLVLKPPEAAEIRLDRFRFPRQQTPSKGPIGIWSSPTGGGHKELLELQKDGLFLLLEWPASREQSSFGSAARAEMGYWIEEQGKIAFSQGANRPTAFSYEATDKKVIIKRRASIREFQRVDDLSTIKL